MTRDEETNERNACDEWFHEKGGASIQEAWVERARRDARDAERYRWLEKNAKCDPKMGGNHHWWAINLRGVFGPTLGIGIDAAIAKETGNA